MRPYSHQAAVYRLLLIAGIVDPAEVISWADAQLAAMEGYDDDLVNLALTPPDSPKRLILALECLIDDEGTHWDALRETMAKLYDVLLADPSRAREIARFLDHEWLRYPDKLPEDLQFLSGVDDSFWLAQDGIYTIESVTRDLLENLKTFKGEP